MVIIFLILSKTAIDSCPLDSFSMPVHTARIIQDCLQANHLDFTGKDQWLPNTPDLNTPEAYHKCDPKLKKSVKLKEMLQSIWHSLAQEPIDKAVKEFRK